MAKLISSCGLGSILSPVQSVSGGYMHRMYRVTTDSGIYAVKHLNPEIMARPDAHKSYTRAEQIESRIEKEGLPIVPSLTFHGRKMQHLEGHYFYLFKWIDGHVTDWDHISNRQCHIAGNLLGRIHAIEPGKVSSKKPETACIDWNGYIARAHGQGSVLTPLLEESKEILFYAVEALNRARASLPDILCLSDGDLDPKNVMWDHGCPWIIDLECLDYGNPISDALSLAMQWAGGVTCNIDPSKITSYFEGYLEAYDNPFRFWGNIFGITYNWVEWLEYNIQRALGDCMDEAEKTMGISEARNTIRRIQYLYHNETTLKAVLDTCLHPQGKLS